MKKTLTKNDFAEMAMARLRNAGDRQELHYDERQFAITDKTGKHMYLQNAYDATLDNHEDGKFVLGNLVRTWCRQEMPIPDSYKDAKADLLLSVDSKDCLEVGALESLVRTGEPKVIPYKAIGKNISGSIVFDLPEGMIDLSQTQLENWNVTFEQAFDDAMKNLILQR